MEFDTSFTKASMDVETATLDIELIKREYMQQVQNSETSKGKGNNGRESKTIPSAMANYKSDTKTLEAAKLTVTTAGSKAF